MTVPEIYYELKPFEDNIGGNIDISRSAPIEAEKHVIRGLAPDRKAKRSYEGDGLYETRHTKMLLHFRVRA